MSTVVDFLRIRLSIGKILSPYLIFLDNVILFQIYIHVLFVAVETKYIHDVKAGK